MFRYIQPVGVAHSLIIRIDEPGDVLMIDISATFETSQGCKMTHSVFQFVLQFRRKVRHLLQVSNLLERWRLYTISERHVKSFLGWRENSFMRHQGCVEGRKCLPWRQELDDRR